MPSRADGVRKQVHDVVLHYPGIHVRGLERHVGISAALAQYHLKRLVAAGYLNAREQGGYTRYFPVIRGEASVPLADVPLLSLMREEVPLHVVLLLLSSPRTHGQLVDELGMAKSTVSYHLAKLADAGIVERAPGTATVRLADAPRIRALLRAYEPMPDLLDALADLWGDLYE